MSTTILALDIGERKIGIARANTVACLPEPLVTLPNDDEFATQLTQLLAEHDVSEVVVGLPRGMDGQTTQQTHYVKDFVNKLHLSIPVHFQDEAVTSIAAVNRLQERGDAYQKEDIDAWAATIILEDFLNQEGNHAARS